MSGVNKVILVGRLGKDVQVNMVGDKTVANFSLATSEMYKDKDGNKKENTEWHNIVIWGKLGEVAAKYLRKGSMCYVEGKLRTRSWDKDGITRYTTEILVDNLVMLDGKPEAKQTPRGGATYD